jgi:hypothetical protein
MKIVSNTLTRMIAFIAFFLMSLQNFAQDKNVGVDVTIKKDNNNWYTQPWVWIVGGAVFILLLVALLRRGGTERD